MPRDPFHYADQRHDAIDLVAALARVPGRHDVVFSNPGTKAEAYSYRQRIYRWRKKVLDVLAHVDSPEAKQCMLDLQHLMGRRFCKNWLDYTRFDIVAPEVAFGGNLKEGWRVRGSVGRVMFGPDIVFDDDPGTLSRAETAQELLDMARLLQR